MSEHRGGTPPQPGAEEGSPTAPAGRAPGDANPARPTADSGGTSGAGSGGCFATVLACLRLGAVVYVLVFLVALSVAALIRMCSSPPAWDEVATMLSNVAWPAVIIVGLFVPRPMLPRLMRVLERRRVTTPWGTLDDPPEPQAADAKSKDYTPAKGLWGNV